MSPKNLHWRIQNNGLELFGVSTPYKWSSKKGTLLVDYIKVKLATLPASTRVFMSVSPSVALQLAQEGVFDAKTLQESAIETDDKIVIIRDKGIFVGKGTVMAIAVQRDPEFASGFYTLHGNLIMKLFE